MHPALYIFSEFFYTLFLPMDQYYRELASYFKKRREASGHSQRTVAKELGYSSPQFISNWERGLCGPPLKKLPRIIDLYGLNRVEVVTVMMKAYKKELERSLKSRR